MLSDKEEFGKWLERGKWIAKRCDEINRELEECRAIGTVEELQAFRSNDFTEDLLNMGYTKGLKDGYAKAIDEFAEALKELSECVEISVLVGTELLTKSQKN